MAEKETKIQIIISFRSYPMRNRKFQTNNKKIEKITRRIKENSKKIEKKFGKFKNIIVVHFKT